MKMLLGFSLIMFMGSYCIGEAISAFKQSEYKRFGFNVTVAIMELLYAAKWIFEI